MSTSMHETDTAWLVESAAAVSPSDSQALPAWPAEDARSRSFDAPEHASDAETEWAHDDVLLQHQPEAASAGVTARGLVALSAAAAAGCVAADLWLTDGRLTFFFDLCFVVLCLIAAMSVRISDLFTAGVLPPLLFAGVIAAVSLAAPSAFTDTAGVGRVFLTGLAAHAFALVAAYAVALATVSARLAAAGAQV